MSPVALIPSSHQLVVEGPPRQQHLAARLLAKKLGAQMSQLPRERQELELSLLPALLKFPPKWQARSPCLQSARHLLRALSELHGMPGRMVLIDLLKSWRGFLKPPCLPLASPLAEP